MGFIKKNGQKKEETDSAANKEYLFPEGTELKACRYCQMMIPKTAKVCPNCRKRSKKNWPGIFLLLCLLAVCAAGVYYYIAVYSVTEQVSADAEAVRSGETVLDAQDGRMPEEELTAVNESAAGNGAVEESTAGIAGTGTDAAAKVENLPEMPTALEGPEDFGAEEDGAFDERSAESEDEKKDEGEKEEEPGKESVTEKEEESEKESVTEKEEESGKESVTEKEEEAEKESELEKDGDPENGSEAEKEDGSVNDGGNVMERAESKDTVKEEDRAGMAEDGEADNGSGSGADLADGTVKMTDLSGHTEEEFRGICKQVDYKKLLRRQELYLNAAVMEELTVVEQVDGGLFDENIYYLCKKEDEQGITRYYIIRDDREEKTVPILEGDVLRIYGQLFGSCELPGYLVRTQPVVPALTMVYYDILAE